MKLTAEKVNERMELFRSDHKEDIIATYSVQIEDVIWDAAINLKNHAYFNAPDNEPVPQVLMDIIRENGFEISREKCSIQENELSYLISW